MNGIPSIKTHPLIVSLIAVAFFIGVFIAGNVSGWFLRTALESRAELAVVLDDSEFMKWLDTQANNWGDVYLNNQEKFYEENKEIPDCLAKPMPQYYLDNDFGLQSKRK